MLYIHEINQRLVVFIEFYHRNISCFINRRGKKKKSIKCTKLTKVLEERFNLQLCIYCAQQKRLILGIFKHIKFLVELCPAMSGDYTTEFSVKCKLHHTPPAKVGSSHCKTLLSNQNLIIMHKGFMPVHRGSSRSICIL